MTRHVYGLKNTPFMNLQHMHFMMDFQERLKEDQEVVTRDGYPIGACGHILKGRPLWMVGKYDICYECYLEQERKTVHEIQIGNH